MRNTPPAANVNANKEGSDTRKRGAAAPNVHEMFNQYIENMFRNAPGPVVGGRDAGIIGVGSAVRQPRTDFSKLKGDFVKVGGKTFNDLKSVMEV